MRTPIVAFLLLALFAPLGALAQVPNEGVANGILAARRKNAALLQQYNWNSRIEVLDNGKMQDLRIDLVTVGPEGNPTRTLLNDQPGKLPGGFLRRAIAQGQQQQADETAKGVAELLDQYTLPSAGKIIAFIVEAQLQPMTSPEGTSLLRVNGSDVVQPGDTVTMVFDGATLLPTSVEIVTTFKGDQATLSATFSSMPSGLNRLQFATASIPSKQLTVQIHNYDFVPIN